MVITSLGVVTMHAHTPTFVACFEGSTARNTTSIGVVASVHRTFDVKTCAVVGQGCVVEQHHSTHCAKSVADALCTFHHFHHARTCVVHFGGVVGSPTLAFEAHTVVHQQNSAGVHTLNHGLGNRSSRADGAHSRDGL